MNNKIGGIIYAHRKVKGLTQEELGSILSVSGTAVSKWERGITYPDIEVFLKMADYFEISTDELFGRTTKNVDKVGKYNEENIEALDTAFELLNIYRISCKEGLLAIENMAEEGMLNKFLTFTVKKVFECFRQEMNTDLIRRLLENYCQAEENKLIARMTVDVVITMFEGVSERTIIEVISSYLGREYGEKLVVNVDNKKIDRQKVLDSYSDKDAEVGYIEELLNCSDEGIKTIIRNVDNVTLVVALSGASGALCKRFLSNISDKLLHFINQDIKSCDVSLMETIDAQKEILKLAVEFGVIEVK